MRKRFMATVAVLICLTTALSGCGGSATNEGELNYPTKPIELIVGYAAGGGTHLAAELLSPNSQAYLGQPLNITCKPGAGGAVGATYVADSKPDGYTLHYATVSLPISLYNGSADYEMDDFIGIALCSDIAPVLAVRADAPYDTAEELIQWCQDNPGQFTWSFPGVGSSLHLSGANALDAMGIGEVTVEVPYDGTAEGVAAVLGGHINGVSCFMTSLSEQVRAGEIKIIGIQAQERDPDWPDIPTFLEQGYDATLTSWRGVFAPSDTPEEIVAYLDTHFEELIMSDEYLERALELGEGRAYMNAEDFTAYYRAQCEIIEEVVKRLGLEG